LKKGDDIELIFSDNGLGIDLEINANNIFGLYKRFHDHTEGKGMGLYMVRKQVEALGGVINIESAVNKGTTFTIVFANN
jgi:signal transduction histidine kinase